MKILKLTVRNFLGVSHLTADKLGKLNKITGGNGVGKTSVVKAIREAFRQRGHDPELIRVGADKSEIIIELTDGVTVERTITPTANRPKVVVNGQPVSSPTTYLAGLLGPFIFNPIEFFNASPKERRTILLSSIPFTINHDALMKELESAGVPVPVSLSQFDYSRHGLEVLEAIQVTVYETRAEQNRSLTQLRKAVEQEKSEMPPTCDAEKYRSFDVAVVAQKIADARVAITNHERDKEKLETMRRRSSELREKIESLQNEIRRLEDERSELTAEGKELSSKVQAFVPPSIDQLEADMAGYKQYERIAHKLEDIAEREEEIEKVAQVHGDLDKLHKALTTTVPKQMLAKVRLPLDGLEIKGDSILIGEVPIDKLSTSEQMTFALNVAKALAGDLKVICIDRWESLDANAKALFEKLAADDDFEYFVTEVTNGELSMEAVESVRTEPLPRAGAGKKQSRPVGADF